MIIDFEDTLEEELQEIQKLSTSLRGMFRGSVEHTVGRDRLHTMVETARLGGATDEQIRVALTPPEDDLIIEEV